MARIEHHTPELACLVLSRPEAVELINLLVAQLGDMPPPHGSSGACPTVRVQDGEQAPSRLSFLVEPSTKHEAKPVAATRFYFFGVLQQVGHYWHPAEVHTQNFVDYRPAGCPWGDYSRQIDGTLCRPMLGGRKRGEEVGKEDQVEGLAWLHVKDGWTALSYWDRSGPDTRFGCNSNFIAEGLFDFKQMLELARKHFPTVIERTKGKFEIVLERQVFG